MMKSVWRPVGIFVSACLLLSAWGCWSGYSEADESGSRVYLGMTMKEVADELGNPNLVIKGDAGTETTWIYRYEGGTSPVVIILAVILVIFIIVLLAASKGGGGGGGWGGGGGGDGPPYQIRITFDGEGSVIHVSPPEPVPNP